MSDPQTSLTPDRPPASCPAPALEPTARRALALLRRHEWMLLSNLMPTCQVCHAPHHRGHYEDCEAAAVMAALDVALSHE